MMEQTNTAVLIRRGEGTAYTLGPEATIGRLDTCDISIPDKSVSREHARLHRGAGGYVIEDLGSTNGTLINGRRIASATPIYRGDMVTVGSIEFLFEEEAHAGGESELVDDNVAGDTERPEDSAPALTRREEEQHPSLTAEQPARTGPTDLAGEIADTAERLVSLVHAFAEQANQRPVADLEQAFVAMEDVRQALSELRIAVTPDQVQTVETLVSKLADSPRDVELLLEVGRHASDLSAVVRGYDELRRAIQAIATTVESS